MTREDQFVALVCKEMKVSLMEILYGGKKRKFSEPKQILTTILYWHTKANQQKIAEMAGYEDRSVITYNEKQVLSLIKTNKDYRDRIVPVLTKAETLATQLDEIDRVGEFEFFDFYSEAIFEQTSTGFIYTETQKEAA